MKNLTPSIDTDKIFMTIPDVNRPALQLAGFFKQFDSERVQIIGNVETAYLMTMDRPMRRARYAEITKYPIPCIIYARDIEPDSCMISACEEAGIPLLSSERPTTELEGEIIRWLKVKMAPMITVHGVLVDVYGEGVLITGDSGIGKSEAALELIKRGHRLVSGDSKGLRRVLGRNGTGCDKALYRASRYRDHRCEADVRCGIRKGHPDHQYGDFPCRMVQG